MPTQMNLHRGYHREDRVEVHDPSIIFRVIATVAAAVPTVLGLIALARFDWGNGGIDAPPVQSGGITFTPLVAIATLVLGIVALSAAATWDRTSKLVVGVLLICAAIVAFAVDPQSSKVILDDALGWMFAIVGAVLVLTAMAMSWMGERRTYATEERI